MSFDEAEILRERAHMFLENDMDLLKRGFYDLAVFNLEQYSQLILRYKLLVKTGTYPRTHSLTTLVDILSRIEPSIRVLLEKEDYLIMLTKLEDAYIGARYLPRRYTEVEVKAILRFIVEVFQKLSKEFKIYIEYAIRMKNLSVNLRDLLLSIKKDILEHVPNAKIYLFGSIARGKYTATSDIDILIVVDSLEGVDIYKLKTLVKKKYHDYPIELHIIDTEMLEKWYIRFMKKEELVEV